MEQLSPEEINERVAILKKFKSLLEAQRVKFQEYLNVLEKQKTSIIEEDPDALLSHTKLEEQIVANIQSLQKVVAPMAALYTKYNVNSISESESVQNLQHDLNALQTAVLAQNTKNRDLIKEHIENIKDELQQIHNPYKNKHSIYSEQKTPMGNLIEIDA